MRTRSLLLLITAAGCSVSCVRQTQTSRGTPLPASAIERQIANAVDAGEGDYIARGLRQRMAAEPENIAVRIELIRHFASIGYPELALEHSRVAATRFPESAEAQLALAKSLRTMGLTGEGAGVLAAY